MDLKSVPDALPEVGAAKTLEPTASLRLRARQLVLLRVGFKLLIGYLEKRLQDAHAAGLAAARTRLVLLADQLHTLFGRHRLRLSAIDLAACMLAVRITALHRRHRHITLPSCSPKLARRLLHRLEILRKRAKRQYIHVHGSSAYREAAAQWRRAVSQLRILTRCGCLRRRPSGGMRFCRFIIDTLMPLARVGLKERTGKELPESELRHAVRLALRHVRRDREYFGIKTLLEEKDFAREFLADFAERRLKRRRQK